MLHPIQYIVLLGNREQSAIPVVAAKELQHSFLFSLGLFPQTLEHLVYGFDYYQSLLNTGEHGGYFVNFIYTESIDSFDEQKFSLYENAICIFLICTDDEACLQVIDNAMQQKHRPAFAYLIRDNYKSTLHLPNVFTETSEIIDFLYVLIHNYISPIENKLPFCVPIVANILDLGNPFNPSKINTFTSQSAVGNWKFPFPSYSYEELIQVRNKAIKRNNTFERQQILIEQIHKMSKLEHASLLLPKKEFPLSDQLNAPLIIALPFTGADIRKQYEIESRADTNLKNMSKAVRFVLSLSNTSNYSFNVDLDKDKTGGITKTQVAFLIEELFASRSYFLDIIGGLHSSFKFSPYLRLPYQGKSLNKTLSFVSPKINELLVMGKNRHSIEQVMMRLGTEIVENTLSSEAKQYLQNYPRQIVAITDLPIEWLNINDTPLGFTHDICRLPEVPIESNLMHYVINETQRYRIPKDIISKTLVVYGCKSEQFKIYQDKADQLSVKIGFHTCECQSLKQFAETIKKYQPHFLIIDTHGGVDLKLHQSYIMMGQERVYPNDIAKLEISAPLVFLSACNTAPTYNSINTVANAMIQSGSIAVTSSYLPLDISESSVLYLRILQQLSEAAKQPVHKNWLAFVSHILRTSFIHGAYHNLYLNSTKPLEEIAVSSGRLLSASMYFENRRTIYKQLRNGKIEDGFKVSTKNVIPHYLMYSTIGRADLVYFECYMETINDYLLQEKT